MPDLFTLVVETILPVLLLVGFLWWAFRRVEAQLSEIRAMLEHQPSIPHDQPARVGPQYGRRRRDSLEIRRAVGREVVKELRKRLEEGDAGTAD